MIITGRVWKFGDDVNTDVIFPGRYTYRLMNDEEMGNYSLIDLESPFNKEAIAGDIIVAGKNWGCGSSREQAVKCLKARGIGAIVARSFARIFYRNSLNEGLPIIICPEAVDAIENREQISIDFCRCAIITEHRAFAFQPYPDFVKALVESGGLLNYVRERLRKRN